MSIEEIRGRLEAATPGPWEIDRYPHGGARIATNFGNGSRELIADTFQERDREFFYNAPEDVRRLLNAVEGVLETATKLDRCHAAGTPYAGQMIREAIRAALEGS